MELERCKLENISLGERLRVMEERIKSYHMSVAHVPMNEEICMTTNEVDNPPETTSEKGCKIP